MAGEPVEVVTSPGNESLTNGFKNFAVAGTAEKLEAASTPCRGLGVQAKSGNMGSVWIGGANVASDGSTGGLELTPGDMLPISANHVDELYGNAAQNGDGVTFLFWRLT